MDRNLGSSSIHHVVTQTVTCWKLGSPNGCWRFKSDQQRCDRLVDMGVLYNGRLGAYIRLRDRELHWDLLDGWKGSDLVQKGMRKELLEFECKMLQIRQVGVNEDPLDPMVAGAWNGLV
ncbi:hypothetical protein F2Q70_00001464 [Brassica cretica]|uniref:Uncharacterized protein n=1 Tax=Brassica cretica TaxID=69181 RepID=A0A8S9IRT5_BRACR|nr:hypothetical protein F2Q70_00001464 [Brassica cretica]